MIDLTDSELVVKAQRGDRTAVDDLLRRHYDRIYAVCFRIAGNQADADDACQEALIAVAKGLARFDGRSSFKTWSYRVASNACLDELRRRKRRPNPIDEFPELIHSSVHIDPAEKNVDERLLLHQVLADLPEEFRVPVVLRDIAGMDYNEIAETLQVPTGTVRSRIARGRQRLAKVLGNQTAPLNRPMEQP